MPEKCTAYNLTFFSKIKFHIIFISFFLILVYNKVTV